MSKTRVLIIDDSALVRSLLSEIINKQPDMEAIGAAFDAAESADVMLVIGSSLQVTPVSQLPGVVLARGGRLAILTESETDYDHRCSVRIHEKAGPTMQAVLTALDA